MICKSSRKQVETVSTKVYIIGPLYSGKNYLCNQLTRNSEGSQILCKPNYKIMKKQVKGKTYAFRIKVQANEKYQAIIDQIKQADIVVLVYDLIDNEQMDYFTFWAQKLKQNIKHNNVIFLGRRMDETCITEDKKQIKIQEILSKHVVQMIRDQNWCRLEISTTSQATINMIWNSLVQKAKIYEPVTSTDATKSSIKVEQLEAKNLCNIF